MTHFVASGDTVRFRHDDSGEVRCKCSYRLELLLGWDNETAGSCEHTYLSLGVATVISTMTQLHARQSSIRVVL